MTPRHDPAAARPLAFVAVASGGFLIRMTIVAILTRALHAAALPATAIGVELAVLHNFLWHERWTWGDRGSPPGGGSVQPPIGFSNHTEGSAPIPVSMVNLSRLASSTFHSIPGSTSMIGTFDPGVNTA